VGGTEADAESLGGGDELSLLLRIDDNREVEWVREGVAALLGLVGALAER
jgi:hypothetical protein